VVLEMVDTLKVIAAIDFVVDLIVGIGLGVVIIRVGVVVVIGTRNGGLPVVASMASV
jgi:hypothetical protein